MILGWLRALYRWAHDRWGSHQGPIIAKYGRVCGRCHLPIRWDATTGRYELRTPLEMHPAVGRSR